MRRSVTFVIIVVILLVAADRAAAWAADRAVAQMIQDSQGLTRRPAVSVKGFPFLTQALGGRYRQVDATVRDLTVDQGVTVDRLDVKLEGVHVKLADAVRQQVTSAPVDAASVVATVGYGALDQAAAQQFRSDEVRVKFGPAPDGQISVTGTFNSGPLHANVNGRARASAQGGNLVVGLVPNSLDALPQVLRARVVAKLGVSYKLPPLPFGFLANDVSVGPAGVTVRAAATSVDLRASGS
jgi:hypothetical protein